MIISLEYSRGTPRTKTHSVASGYPKRSDDQQPGQN
jgi:hypothetical protein